jgi:hypothetical protein
MLEMLLDVFAEGILEVMGWLLSSCVLYVGEIIRELFD